MKKLLTTGEAAELLLISKPTLIRAVEGRQILPLYVTPGGHRRFLTDDVVRFGLTLRRADEGAS